MNINHRLLMYTLIGISLLFSATTAYFNASSEQQSFYSVDVKQINIDFISTISNSKLTKEAKNKKAAEFGTYLSKYLQQLSDENNAILIVKPAVIDGMPDLTADVKEAVFRGTGLL